MRNFIQAGRNVTLTAPYALNSGDGALIGSLFGVAVTAAASGAEVALEVEGVFDLTRETGAGTAWSAGVLIYWDNTNKRTTKAAAGNKVIGIAVKAAADGDATGRVRLNDAGLPQFFVSAEQTGTGSAQNIAHGLGVVPSFVFVIPTDLAPATIGQYTETEGAHTATNVVVTVTSGKKYKVVAIA